MSESKCTVCLGEPISINACICNGTGTLEGENAGLRGLFLKQEAQADFATRHDIKRKAAAFDFLTDTSASIAYISTMCGIRFSSDLMNPFSLIKRYERDYLLEAIEQAMEVSK